MTPKADLSCRKTYKKWYYITFYFKNELRYYIYLFSWSFWRPFWIWPLEVTRGHANFVYDGFWKHKAHTPNTMPNFKNLSPSAGLLKILWYSTPATCEIYKKKIEISTFIRYPKRKTLIKVQFKVLKKHFSLFIFNLEIKSIFWHMNIAKLENRKK